MALGIVYDIKVVEKSIKARFRETGSIGIDVSRCFLLTSIICRSPLHSDVQQLPEV